MAAALEFPSENLFLEWVIALGNDFTADLDPQLFSDFPPSLTNTLRTDRTRNRFDVLKTYIISQGTSFRLTSVDPTLTTAIQFSRKLYNLEDISTIPIDNPPEDIFRMTNLSDQQLDKIDDFIHSSLKNKYKNKFEMTAHTVGMMVVDFWSSELCAENSTTSGEIDLSEHLNACYLQALRDMIEVIASSDGIATVEEELCRLDITKNGKKIKSQTNSEDWDRFLAANAYQVSCVAFISGIRNQIMSRGQRRVEPYKLYDPQVFALCVRRVLKDRVTHSVPETLRSRDNSTAASQANVHLKSAPVTLPIDQHREEILHRIGRDRVTVIHGETGCGKSSRLPLMLLEDAENRGVSCKMMVSQPRRIAATGLYDRVRTTIGSKAGLRMGHGVRHESTDTKIFFVTTGYLVRLLAHRPSVFNGHSHLIIDEVHERSVDGDVLCLLARRLLQRNRHIRIVLMSATIHTELYRDYFRTAGDIYGDIECLSVGVRRFPLQVHYLEQIPAQFTNKGNFVLFNFLCG